MTQQYQTVKESVANAMADDYESLEIILADVAKEADKYGFSFDRQMVLRALKELTDEGYAQAYDLSPQPPHAAKVEYSEDRVDDLWFYLTPKGISFFCHPDNE
jgi:hypothetical protein